MQMTLNECNKLSWKNGGPPGEPCPMTFAHKDILKAALWKQSDCLGILMGAFSQAFEIKGKSATKKWTFVIFGFCLTDRNGVCHQVHTHTTGTNVSHVLTSSDNREPRSCIHNDGTCSSNSLV